MPDYEGYTNQAVGVGMGMYQNAQQKRQAEQMMAQQFENQKELAGMQWDNQLKMWVATSYSAQKREMEKAGLNPGLMYGMGGGGGQTEGSGAPSTGSGQVPQQQNLANAMQLGLMRAQKENIEADTANKKVDAEKKAGVDTEAVKVGIENTKTQTAIARLDEWIKGKSKEDAADLIMWQSQKIMNEANNEWQQGVVDKATMTTRMEMVKAELANKLADTELKDAQKNLSEKQREVLTEEVRKWIREGVQKWKELEISGEAQATNNERMMIEKWRNDMPESTKAIIGTASEALQAIIFGKVTRGKK